MTKDGATKYIETVGRRKTSVARVRITPSSKQHIVINDRALADYFPVLELQRTVEQSLHTAKGVGLFSVTAVVKGGGMSSQAESVRHGIARALVEFDHSLRASLKKHGYLKRNPKAKERRKFGLKKARKAPQWSKR